MSPSLGLQHRLLLGLVAAGLLILVVLGGLWQLGTRSNALLVEKTADAIGQQVLAELSGRAELHARFLSELLPNRIYYLDLLGIGEAARTVLEQPDVAYVLVYDTQGRLVHDGTRDIEGFGEVMADPLAAVAIGASGVVVQWTDDLVELNHPVMLGRERIGGVRVALSRSQSDATTAALQQALASRLRAAFLEQLRYLLLGFSVLVLGAAVFGVGVGRGLVRPIRELAAAARRLEQGRYDPLALDSRRGDELGDLVRAFSRMAASVRAQDAQIRALAYRDPLTGLPNRLKFRELMDGFLARYREQGQAFGLLFIDLDDFKPVNDTLGHEVGDKVLQDLARTLEQCAAEASAVQAAEPAVLARLGGDEFVALVAGQALRSRCAALAERILGELRQPFVVDGRTIALSVSIGIALCPDDGQDSRQLLRCADLAMYQAKQAGKNTFAHYTRPTG